MITKRLLTAALALLVVAALGAPAQAQIKNNVAAVTSETLPKITSPSWTANFAQQTALQLRSKNKAIREQALINIITIANHPQHQNVDLSPVVNALSRVYEESRIEEQQMMALVALHVIGDEASMNYLAELSQRLERSDRVRRLTQAILRDYFGV